MADDLPSEFDLIVVGTGFTESVVAAAGSRIGKTVLHIDPNDFYGGVWASFNLENMQHFVDGQRPNNTQPSSGSSAERTNNVLMLNGDGNNRRNLEHVEYEWFVDDEPEVSSEVEVISSTEDAGAQHPELSSDSTEAVVEKTVPLSSVKDEPSWNRRRVLKESRKFNIDLTPKLLYARGDLVELLISSNICRYAEFRAVDKVTTIIQGIVKAVPCSRSDVFTTKDVSVVEKRFLMKVLQACVTYNDDSEEFKDYTTFRQYLESKSLTAKLIHYILYAIGMCDDTTACIDGVKQTKKFLSSLGRYGNTPFLFPMYGCGEIPQCFCRLCAVFGGVYCLKRAISEIHFDASNQVKAIKCGDQVITGKNIVFGNNFNPTDDIFGDNDDSNSVAVNCNCGQLSRAIYITDRPIGDDSINSGGGGVNFMKLHTPAAADGDNRDGAFVIQLAHFSGTTPKGLYLIHIITKAKDNPKVDVEPYRNQLFAGDGPTILWAMHFIIPACLKCAKRNASLPGNVQIACGPMFELDYDQSIKQARDIFAQIYPDEEFLPRAPDPEDIIIEGETTTDASIVDFDAVTHEDNIKDRIEEVGDGVENTVECIEENAENETKT